MTDNDKQKKTPHLIHTFGTFDFAGKEAGTYTGGVLKLRREPAKDILESAESFLNAADRCLNSCKLEEDIEILTIPATVCASLSCELFLKYILLIENGKNSTGHSLLSLFQKCSTEVKAALTVRRADIQEVFARNSKQFIESRYHHESEEFSFRPQELFQTAELLSNFLKDNFKGKDT